MPRRIVRRPMSFEPLPSGRSSIMQSERLRSGNSLSVPQPFSVSTAPYRIPKRSFPPQRELARFKKVDFARKDLL